MTIRMAEATDVERLVELALEFLSSTPAYAWMRRSPPAVANLVIALLELDRAAIIVAELDRVIIGGIALLASPHPTSGELWAEEVAWFVDPAHRGRRLVGPRLLVAAEDWALQKGVIMLKMVEPLPGTVGRFYQHQGYRALETAWVKVLRPVT